MPTMRKLARRVVAKSEEVIRDLGCRFGGMLMSQIDVESESGRISCLELKVLSIQEQEPIRVGHGCGSGPLQ